MVLVNIYIIYNLALKKKQNKPITHNNFFKEIQAKLIQVSAEDFTCGLRRKNGTTGAAGVATPSGHELVETTDTRVSSSTPESKQRRQRNCKVCSILKVRSHGITQLIDLTNVFLLIKDKGKKKIVHDDVVL